MGSQELKGHLDLLVLSAVAGGSVYGYSIVGWLREQSGDEFALPENTVYAALHRLERDGLLASSRSLHEGRTRREYVLTPRGRREREGRQREWERFSKGVQRILEAVR